MFYLSPQISLVLKLVLLMITVQAGQEVTCPADMFVNVVVDKTILHSQLCLGHTSFSTQEHFLYVLCNKSQFLHPPSSVHSTENFGFKRVVLTVICKMSLLLLYCIILL